VTEVLSWEEVAVVGHFADMLQIGARNMQNFTLLRAASRSGKPILLKRGAGSTIEEWLMAAEYILARAIRTSSCASADPHLRAGDAAHARSQRGGNAAGADPPAGDRRPEPRGRCAVAGDALSLGSLAVGACGLIVEVHPDPSSAMSDGAQSLDIRCSRSWRGRCIPSGRRGGWWRWRRAGRRAGGQDDMASHPERSEGAMT